MHINNSKVYVRPLTTSHYTHAFWQSGLQQNLEIYEAFGRRLVARGHIKGFSNHGIIAVSSS